MNVAKLPSFDNPSSLPLTDDGLADKTRRAIIILVPDQVVQRKKIKNQSYIKNIGWNRLFYYKCNYSYER